MSGVARKVLYISGSIGLGHVTRDLAIARELRRRCPEVEISWLAAAPADRVLRDAGEDVLPECSELVDESGIAEGVAEGARLNLIRYGFRVARKWAANVEVLRAVTARQRFDLVVGDETYDVTLAFKRNPRLKEFPYATMYDFAGFHATSASPLEKLGVWFWNRAWSKGWKRPAEYVDLTLFLGEEEEIPDEPFGFLLPNRREWARARCRFTGYVLPFDPREYAERPRIREKLGYGTEPLVVCAIGGTSIGKELLELCARAFPSVRERIPGLRMVLVCGPRLAATTLDVPPGVEVRGYVPALHEHLAASDLAIVQGGGTTTLELTVLRRPFLFFPIEGHSEQEVTIAARLARHGAGVRMSLSRTSPSALAEAIAANVGKEVTYPPVAADGARKAAELIGGLLEPGLLLPLVENLH